MSDYWQKATKKLAPIKKWRRKTVHVGMGVSDGDLTLLLDGVEVPAQSFPDIAITFFIDGKNNKFILDTLSLEIEK